MPKKGARYKLKWGRNDPLREEEGYKYCLRLSKKLFFLSSLIYSLSNHKEFLKSILELKKNCIKTDHSNKIVVFIFMI